MPKLVLPASPYISLGLVLDLCPLQLVRLVGLQQVLLVHLQLMPATTTMGSSPEPQEAHLRSRVPSQSSSLRHLMNS